MKLAIPINIIFLTGIALIITLSPILSQSLAMKRELIFEGSWWLILSGHFTHWSTEHLIWDALTFAFLGYLIEREKITKVSLITISILSAIAISVSVLIFNPEIQTYRGLSGLCVTFFVILTIHFIRQALEQKDKRLLIIASTALFLLGAKIIFEMITGTTIFVSNSEQLFTVLPLAHFVGAGCGIVIMVSCIHLKS